MSRFTQVCIRRGTEGLGRSKGFWSGKDVLFNNDTSSIYVLDEKTTTRDVLDTIQGLIEFNLRDWVLWDMRRSIQRSLNGKFATCLFDLHSIPSLNRDKWKQGCFVSLPRMLECWKNDCKTPDQLSEFLADEWVAAWRHDPSLSPNFYFWVPKQIPLARLLLVRWDRIDPSMSLETFLQNMWNLAELKISGARCLGPGRLSEDLIAYKENFRIVRDILRCDELEVLAKCGFSLHLEGEMTSAKVRAILTAPVFATTCLLVLAQKGLLLPPQNLGAEPLSRIRELELMKPFDRWFVSREHQMRFSAVLLSSTIREPRDIPSDLREFEFVSYNRRPNLKILRRMLIEYGQENDLSPFDLTRFESYISIRVEEERKMWRPQWFRDQGYPEAWCNFSDAAFLSSRSGIEGIVDQLKSFCQWALDHFESPWDITALDLINPHDPKKSDTFAAFCKKRIAIAGKGGQDPNTRWIKAAGLFKRVKNFVSNPGYPWYREGASNPFELICTPFKSSNRKGQKTHRSRIATLIHEKMIEVLLDMDKDGTPTFAWARTQFAKEDTEDNGTWCPSRWTALAVLLLLPPRKKSVRWLDQGLMDEKVFDPETFKMVDNNHPLRNYTYEDGQTHQQRYGRASGVIQQMTDDFMGSSDHIGLFINTNKTQLWNPERRNGYELPWPDGSELLASNDQELRQHGLWLRRVYQVLAYQYRHVMAHDPNPAPITFADVRCDAAKVSANEDCARRMPRFVPLFRDTSNRKAMERDASLGIVAMPLTDSKLENAYIALCLETETRLKSEGFDSVCLTMPRTRKGAALSGISSRNAKFDIHCLRVAGISRLIEIGVDPVIVQEFVAGHLTPAMTHRYLKMQPWHVREKIIEAIVNGDFKSAMETFAEKVAKGEWDREKTFVGLPRFQEHVANLPEDFACFSVVKGGICVMGGKGDACNEGGVYERQGDGKDTVDVDFGPVQGGCGNCIYFRTAAFLLQEQTLVLNVLLAELRAQARERKEMRTKISDLTCKIDEAEETCEKNRLISDKSLLEARIEELNHDMVPRLTEWVNRYIMLKECESQLNDLLNGNSITTALVAPFGDNIGLTAGDLKVDQEMTPDIGLIGRIVEGGRILGAQGIAVPEDHARFLERAVDKLLRMNGSQHLLLDVPAGERVHGASMLFNALEALIGAEAIQKALDSETPLAMPESLRCNVNQFAGALVGAARKGRLTVDNLLEEGRSCNMISDPNEGDYIWGM